MTKPPNQCMMDRFLIFLGILLETVVSLQLRWTSCHSDHAVSMNFYGMWIQRVSNVYTGPFLDLKLGVPSKHDSKDKKERPNEFCSRFAALCLNLPRGLWLLKPVSHTASLGGLPRLQERALDQFIAGLSDEMVSYFRRSQEDEWPPWVKS